ncbi:MAG: type II toxin-antitoxin system Phd/YefM family antitoxin [Candidatus Aminicenantales bacterium]
MRFAGVKELKQKTMDLLRESEKGDIIITAYGKPAAVLHFVTQEDVEDYLIENDPGFRSKIEKAYAEYLKLGGLAADDLLRKLEKGHAQKTV